MTYYLIFQLCTLVQGSPEKEFCNPVKIPHPNFAACNARLSHYNETAPEFRRAWKEKEKIYDVAVMKAPATCERGPAMK